MEPTNQTHTAEEEAANRAAAELQRKKKRKKRLHRILFLVIVLLMAGGAYGYYRYQQYQAAQAEAAADVLALADGEALTYGEITEVVGNDITVAVVVEALNAGSSEVNAKAADDTAEAPSAGGSDDNTIDADGAPSGDMPSMPSGNSGDMPSMPSGDSDSMPSMPSGDTETGSSAAAGGSMPSMRQQTSYTQTGETKEYEIPVGTAVTSSLGSTTTFAKLKTGNIIGIVTQEGTDNILRIKIVQ